MSEIELKERLLGSSVSDSKPKLSMEKLISDFEKYDPTSNFEFKGHTGQCWACAMTSDNETLFSGSDDRLIKVWSNSSKTLIRDLEGHTDCVYCLELTKDDRFLISGGWDFQILLWDWRNGRIEATIGAHTNQVFAMCLTSDGLHLVTGGRDSYARVWDLRNRTQLGEMHCGGDSVFSLVVTYDKKEILTADGQQNIRVFNYENYQLLSSNPTNDGVPQCITVTSDKKFIIFGTRTFHVNVWNFGDKSLFHSFRTHLHWVRGVTVSSDNNFIFSASADKTIRIYSLSNKTEETKLNSDGFINSEYLSKDGQYLIASSTDKIMRIWKVGIPVRCKVMTGHKNTIICLAVTADNRFVVTGSEDKTIRIWNIAGLCEVGVLEGHSETIWAICVTQDMKKILSASADKTVRIWDFTEKALIHTMQGSGGVLYAITVSNDGKYAVSGGNDMRLVVWDLNSKTLLKVLEGHTDTVFTVKFLKNAKTFVSGAADYTIRIWNVDHLDDHSHKIETGTGMIESITFNADETFMVIGDRNNKVHLWDWVHHKKIKTFTNHTNWIKSVSFSPDGNTFLSAASDFQVRLWNASEQRHEYLLKGHTNFVRSACFTSDGRFVISAGNDMTVRVWDILGVSDSELVDIGSTIDSFLYLSKIKNKVTPDKNSLNVLYSPLRLNLAHLYAQLGYDNLLKTALRMGSDIRIDAEGHSPLYYALKRRSQNCIDVIFEFIIELRTTDFEKFKNYAYALRDDFAYLLDNRSEYLPEFLSTIFYKVPDLISFAVPKYRLPRLEYTENKEINPFDFVYKPDEANPDALELPIRFHMLPFAIPYIKGSNGSLEILESISECKNKDILETDLIKTFVRNKWDELWASIFAITLILWINLFLIVLALILKYKNNDADERYIIIVVLLVFVNVLLTLYEVFQGFSEGFSYFLSTWNIIDLFRIVLTFSWIYASFYDSTSYFELLSWSMTIINFLRGLSGFRAFDSTRFYTRLIIRAFFDSIAFLWVFFYATLAFGVIFYASNMDSKSDLAYFWRWPYELSMGGFDTQGKTTLEYVCFMFGTIINVIIILNLLISILGDSFDSFQSESKQIDCLEMVELIIELETLMVWNRDKDQKRYFQKIIDITDDGSKNWEGKLKAVTDLIHKLSKQSAEHFKVLNDKNDEILQKLDLYKPK